MMFYNLSRVAIIQVLRHPVRTTLTILGVATGLFFFTVTEIMQNSLKDATEVSAKDTMLIVYRQNRFCPFASRLPESYEKKISSIPGVREVYPIKIVVNVCSTSLDVVTFRGIPRNKIDSFSSQFKLISGSLEEWKKRSDAALVGKVLAERRRVSIGDKLSAAGITVTVAGIIESDNPQNMNVGYLHLDYLQQASKTGLGIVTQFNVLVDDPERLESLASEIDEIFRYEQDPTYTAPEKAFVAQTMSEVILLIRSGRYVAWAAVFLVFALICNTIIIAVRGRQKEYAIFRTIGYSNTHLTWMILTEGIILGFAGGIIGLLCAAILVHLGKFSISSDALSIVFSIDFSSIAMGFAISIALGLLSGLIPICQLLRQDIVNNLRTE